MKKTARYKNINTVDDIFDEDMYVKLTYGIVRDVGPIEADGIVKYIDMLREMSVAGAMFNLFLDGKVFIAGTEDGVILWTPKARV